ncbi:amidase family protein [Aquamicrobium defluvii]|uniref:Amidase n=1 Tax=Aquamicrobium defluvii TaxID=69279 RepID=A0A011U946_9HYPH|nr:amidase family protein [Aquamicrobium defluvii]EXL02383.1 amidase [Aquamicrobium defluvii]EZQ13123.1 amidase [Halopseudomonas bauzanensis]TDR32877.1 amidase/aspartyl-tRNA(Asn)/glutamyl-tRNA(Gln) amidotransferase subunit A [Aquamicrobium defluvii]
MLIEELSRLTLTEVTECYASGRLCPVMVMEATIAQAEAANNSINALYDLQADRCLAEAEASRQRYRTGSSLGLLDGIPVTIKDSIHAAGMHWHHGSAAHGSGVEGMKDAPPTIALKRAGALIFAKTVMSDFGLSSSGVSSSHGIVRNPWGLGWSTGGSSAGAGASLAAGIGMAAVGTDIAGSVRLPASHCGLAALKPTQGLIAHTPPSTVRSAGPMARYAADLEPMLRVLGGVHRDDCYSAPFPAVHAGSDLPRRVTVCLDFGFGPQLEDEVAVVVEQAAQALAELAFEVRFEDRGFDFDAYLPIDDSLKLRGWREYSATAQNFRAAVPSQLVDWLMPASEWGEAQIAEMDKGIARTISGANALLDKADMLLTPVMHLVNFPAGDLGPDPDMPLRHATFTAPFNQSGHPAATICGGFSASGLPIGIQLIGHRFDDIRLVRTATLLEERLRQTRATQMLWPLQPKPLARQPVHGGNGVLV